MIVDPLCPCPCAFADEGQLWLSDFGLSATAEQVLEESTVSVRMVRSRGKPTGAGQVARVFVRQACIDTVWVAGHRCRLRSRRPRMLHCDALGTRQCQWLICP
jgi:hypothetical protein